MKELLEAFLSAINNWVVSPPVKGAMAAGLVAILRILYDDTESSNVRKVLEATFCGSIAWFSAYALPFVGLSYDLSIFLGGAIGLIGADKVRSWARNMAQQRINKLVPEEKKDDSVQR